MGKRKRTRRKRGPSLATRLGEWLGGISWSQIARGVLNTAMLAALVTGAAYGLPVLKAYVSALPEYRQELTLELVDPPAWLEGNEHVAQYILDRCGVDKDARRLDNVLARRVVGQLNLIGWVKQVHEVSIGADDVVRICCDYREPVAWVGRGGRYYLVDDERVRLPGRYSPAEVSRDSGLMLVKGVALPPPDEGQPWRGGDLAAAVEMIRLLRERPYYDQITGVIVDNYGGRRSRSAPHIELATDRGGRIRWGRAPGEEIDEPTAAQKLAHLQGIWREFDRVDMGRAWIDIQVWPDQVLVPERVWGKDVRKRS